MIIYFDIFLFFSVCFIYIITTKVINKTLPPFIYNFIQRIYRNFFLRCEELPIYKITYNKCRPSGLRNMNENCYMNSLIQSLASSDKIINQFKELQKIDGEHKLVDLLIDILTSVNNSESTPEENSSKLMKFSELMNWGKDRQQDTFDFLCAIIKNIQLEIKDKSMFQCPLKIKVMYKITGMEIPNKTQDHLGLSLGLCGNYSVSPGVLFDDLFKEYFTATLIDDDETKTSQLFIYGNVPDVLIIHIQANKWDSNLGEMYKPKYHIIYEKHPNISFKVMSTSNEMMEINYTYDLHAVIYHMGEISSGHYITYRKFQDKWFLANDTQIEEVLFNCDVCPYILVYVSR